MLNDRIMTKLRALPKYLCKVLTVSFVLKSIVAFTALYFITSYVHTATYIWQCTTLADALIPVARHSCPGITEISMQSSSANNPSVAVLVVYDKSYGGKDKNLVSRIIKNRENYCTLHGCTVVTHITTETDTTQKIVCPPAWSKLTAMLEQLKTNKFAYVLYIDMDMIILNPKISPQRILALAPPEQDFVLTNDWSGVNTGIMFARNSEFSKWFLQTAWDQDQLVGKFSADGKPHPFEYEQRAFHFLLNSDIWQYRQLPQYRGNSTELRRHFTALPQCTMNSYLLHPLELRADRKASHYVEGDFLVHLAGKKGQIKMDLMNFFLTMAEEEYRA